MSLNRTSIFAAALATFAAAQAHSAAQTTVTLTASPTSVAPGGTSVLTWSSNNADRCYTSGAGWTNERVEDLGSLRSVALKTNSTFSVNCVGASGWTSAHAYVTVTNKAPTVTVSASPTTVTAGSSTMLNWSASNASSCAATGGWTASGLAASGSQKVANLTKSTSFTMNCKGAAGSASKSTTVLVQAASTSTPPASTSSTPTTTSAGAVSRPSYNTGDGFFVLNGKLYDPDGIEFRIRGVDRAHYDSNSEAGIAASGANAARVFVGTNYGQTWAGLANIINTQHVAHQQVAIPAIPLSSGGVLTTCSSDNGALTAAVNDWVASAKNWTPLNRYTIINIANEWGPRGSTVWRDQYIAAIKTMRSAGYTGALMVDSGGCGQDQADLLNYAADVFNADPQKNIVFSFHVYGGIADAASAQAYFAKLKALQDSAGLVFVLGEFGPGRNIGPSPTMVTPGQVISAAEANGLGWMAWAWDDNNLGGCKSNDSWFSMTYNCGAYTQTSDLTIFGQDVVLNSTYGLKALAKKPNW